MNSQPTEDAKHEGMVSLKCRTTDTTILCACHYTPMWWKQEFAEKWREEVSKGPGLNEHGSFAICSVCRHIDLIWLKEYERAVDLWAERWKNRGLLDAKEPPPDMVGFGNMAFEIIIPDYNKNPTKYRSICEGKLQIARKTRV